MKILCLDFDGVLHSYDSGWKGAEIVTDPPVKGAMLFLWEAVETFNVHIYSARSASLAGRLAMLRWVQHHLREYGQVTGADEAETERKLSLIKWPKTKPPASVTLDDRALQFTGTFPSLTALKEFEPWNKGGPVYPSHKSTLELFQAALAVSTEYRQGLPVNSMERLIDVLWQIEHEVSNVQRK